MTFKGFNDSKGLLDRSQYFDMLEDKEISSMVTRFWKKPFNNGVITPVKVKRCNECRGIILCVTCNNQVNETQQFEANINLLKDKLLTNVVTCFLILKIRSFEQNFL